MRRLRTLGLGGDDLVLARDEQEAELDGEVAIGIDSGRREILSAYADRDRRARWRQADPPPTAFTSAPTGAGAGTMRNVSAAATPAALTSDASAASETIRRTAQAEISRWADARTSPRGSLFHRHNSD